MIFSDPQSRYKNEAKKFISSKIFVSQYMYNKYMRCVAAKKELRIQIESKNNFMNISVNFKNQKILI